MEYTIIAAVAENGVIGKDGAIPWDYSEDLQHFRDTTMGHPCIMGRTTYNDIFDRLGTPLPGRTSIVLTSTPEDVPGDVIGVDSIAAARTAAEGTGMDEAYVIGGASVYDQFLDQADRMILTEIPERPSGDTHFPAWDETDWEEVERWTGDEIMVSVYEPQ